MDDFIILAGIRMPTELAITVDEQQLGLMYRDPPFPIMSFPYTEKKSNSFWMANVRAGLDIIFCLGNQIIAIHQGEPHSTKLIGGVVSDLVVEVPQGTANRLGLQIGDSVQLQYDSNSLNRLLANSKY